MCSGPVKTGFMEEEELELSLWDRRSLSKKRGELRITPGGQTGNQKDLLAAEGSLCLAALSPMGKSKGTFC